ncbi:MAG: hypothetical protein ABSB96_01090 [Gaiellaceae bacterium]
MLRFVRSGSWIGYVLVAAIATVAAGGGFAFGASSAGTLHACANKKTGALRLASKCKKSEKKVSWNVRGARGVAGPAGVAGLAGAAGTAGATGPSDAWEASSPGMTDVTSTEMVLSVTVPAGSYEVTGIAQEQNRDGANPATLNCGLRAGTTPLNDTFSTAPVSSGGTYGYGAAANVVHAGYTTSTDTTFSLTCSKAGSPASLYVRNATLSAIKVGTIH